LWADERLGAVAERMLRAQPRAVRRLSTPANRHMRWELDDPARRLDNQQAAAELREGLVPAPAGSASGLSPDGLRMFRAIDELPEEERAAFDLVRVHGTTYPEAVQSLGVSAAAVKRRLNRGLRLLAEQLADLRQGEKLSDSIKVHTGRLWVLSASESWHAAASRNRAVADESRVQQLLEEISDSGRSPEEVCAACPELLPEVRRLWEQMCAVEAQLDALFPTPGADRYARKTAPGHAVAHLPRIPGYDVETLLGRGGMGVVYKARHRRLNRLVALKMLIAGPYTGPHERARFQREAEAVASLHHANIVQVYDVGDHEGLPYFTMELLEGGNLAQSLAGTPQPAHQAAALVATLAEAMQVAHRVGIAHRDLKPANILLGADGTPKIADFGLARHFDGERALTLSDVRMGTPSYMAPEQVIGKAGATGPAADIYALGALLYEMLTGRPPFRGETTSETERQVVADEPVPPARLNPKVPRDLETICLKCLHKDPQRRYADAGALAADVRRFVEGRPVQARRVSPLERAWRWCRRNPAGAALALMVLALVGLSIGGALWVQRKQLERRIAAELTRGRARLAIEEALGHQEDLRQQGLWEDARSELTLAETRLNDAGSDELRRRLVRAHSALDQAVRAEAEDPGLVLRMAKAEAELGRAGRVEALLQRATSRRSRDPNTWVQSGLVRDRLGRTDQAVADFVRAIELLPRDRFFASPRSRLIVELAGHERVYSALLQARPDDKELWIGRGRYQALRDRWWRAAADYARGIEPIPSPDTQEYYEYACLLLLVEDKERYRGLIQTLREQVDKTKDPRLAYELARGCIITPEMTADPKRVVGWARLAEESAPRAWHRHVVGAAYYRAGDYGEALRWLGNSLERDWQVGRPLNQFLLTMIHRRMGHAESAATLYKESIRLYEEMESRRVDGAVPGVFAADWMTIQIYRREAELLFTDSSQNTLKSVR
jgi:tetratricopeptide (TPR) repeat protein/tRNA A-37 threonylcarbamoyl transferase component Bud32